MLDHSCQVQRHSLKERGDDLYETPPVATEALLRAEPALPKRSIWDPCCGLDAIVNVLRAQGFNVLATDLVDHGIEPPGSYRRDFLLEREVPVGVEAIVTNPPFKLAEQFVAHALELCPLVIMLLRLAFMESERRCGILEGRGLARVHVFRRRLPMMHRAGWEGGRPTAAWRSLGLFGTAATLGRQSSTEFPGTGERRHDDESCPTITADVDTGPSASRESAQETRAPTTTETSLAQTNAAARGRRASRRPGEDPMVTSFAATYGGPGARRAFGADDEGK